MYINGVCAVPGCGHVAGEADNTHTHVYDQQTVNDETLQQAATCTAPAFYFYSCACGQKGTTTFTNGTALGHDEQSHAARAATCTAIGWDAYVTCSRCDYTTYTERAALGHSYASGVCATCGATNPDYVAVDSFAANQPVLNADQTDFEWSGNWMIGDMDADGNYREFNTVHKDVNNPAYKWLVYTPDEVDTYPVAFWGNSAGYYLSVSGRYEVGTAIKYDAVIVWTAPEDGAVKIGATDFTLSSSTNFDFTVCLNGVQIYPAQGKMNVSYDGSEIKDKDTFVAAFANFTIDVKQGDKLQFRCSRNSSDKGSNKVFMPTVEYVNGDTHQHVFSTTWRGEGSVLYQVNTCSECGFVSELLDTTVYYQFIEPFGNDLASVNFYACEGMTWRDVCNLNPELFEIVELTVEGETFKTVHLLLTDGSWDSYDGYVYTGYNDPDGVMVRIDDVVEHTDYTIR